MLHSDHPGHALIPEKVGPDVVICFCLECACLVRVRCPEGRSVRQAILRKNADEADSS